MSIKKSVLWIILLVVLSLLAAQCGGAAPASPLSNQASNAGEKAAVPGGPQIKILEPMARASIPNGAIYLTLTNEGDEGDALISAQTDVADSTELHETKIDEQEVMRMSPVDKIEVPAGGSVKLKPGGLHVMLIGLKEGISQGDKISLTLNFEKSGTKMVEVEVTEGVAMVHKPEAEMAPDHTTSSTVASQPQHFQVVVVAYLMDTAGFHEMDERLNEGGQIDPGDAGTVNRVNRLLAVTDWPEELKPQAEALQAVLTSYAEALANDDLEAAKALAAQTHETQHDLSHAMEAWLGGENGHGHEEDEMKSPEHEREHSEEHEHSEEKEG